MLFEDALKKVRKNPRLIFLRVTDLEKESPFGYGIFDGEICGYILSRNEKTMNLELVQEVEWVGGPGDVGLIADPKDVVDSIWKVIKVPEPSAQYAKIREKLKKAGYKLLDI
jgi:hypothetical protein